MQKIVKRMQLQPLIIFFEMGLSTWMSLHYQGIMFFTLYLTMFVYLQVIHDRFKWIYLPLQFIALQIAIFHRPPVFHAIADLLFITFVLILIYLSRSDQSKSQIEQLYDAIRNKHYELDEARNRLIEYAKQVQTMTQNEERNRISRDIHDDLGHKLIRLKLMTDAAIHIIPSDPTRGMEMIHSVRDQLAESMELMRTTVRKLQPEKHTLHTYSLETLINGIGTTNGIQVFYQIHGLPYLLYPSHEFILYRNAQEAITNAIRHGSASEVYIELLYEPQQVIMQISNNGNTTNNLKTKGLGLSGMEERTQLVGGKLALNTDMYFTVTTTLPTRHKS
ncbi:Sensor histidine kinase DesK [compost metagenome]